MTDDPHIRGMNDWIIACVVLVVLGVVIAVLWALASVPIFV